MSNICDLVASDGINDHIDFGYEIPELRSICRVAYFRTDCFQMNCINTDCSSMASSCVSRRRRVALSRYNVKLQFNNAYFPQLQVSWLILQIL